jgi:hypothetical protein
MRHTSTLTRTGALVALAGLISPCLAQPGKVPSTPPAPQPAPASTGIPARDTLLRMMRPVSGIEFKDQRLEDVMTFIATLTDADLEVLWLDDKSAAGLDKDATITFKFTQGSALALLEKTLEKASADAAPGSASTWQLSESGAMQVGPRERLNAFRRLKIYPVRDLLIDYPNFTNAPEFDLQAALQSRKGGGGGQSPFRDTGRGQQNQNQNTIEQRMEDFKKLLTTLVETEQWQDNGGSGASIQYFQGTFLINAPDYVHRAIDGYEWWPAEGTRVAIADGRRWVSLSLNAANAKIDGVRQTPVTAAVPGRGLVPSNNPGGGNGGGGATAPAAPKPGTDSNEKPK